MALHFKNKNQREGVRPPLMPIGVFLYCLFVKGLVLNGRAGIFYALQRMYAEAVLSLMVLWCWKKSCETTCLR
jgi:hypothetical protein